MDNKTKILIVLPPLLITVLIVIATKFISFKEELTETERSILEFTPSSIEIINIKRGKTIHTDKELKGLLDFSSSSIAQRYPSTEGNLSSTRDYNEKKLSLIVITEGSKMAIINGIVAKEGDSINGVKIAKIEADRVLLKNKDMQWLYLKEVKQKQSLKGKTNEKGKK